MTHSDSKPLTAREMLAETQNYRTSLESLLEVGRTLLLNPSMEDGSATAFKILTEGVLEAADHQGDLAAVDGVAEPGAVVELIMQDILTPRLTDVESIERALQLKADNEEPVPFTTRDSETAASMESVHHKAEVLDLFLGHITDVKTIMASVENLSVDVMRPIVTGLLARAGEGVEALGISMEDMGQTQVLGELAGAVDRIEALVSKAHEAATEISDKARAEAESVGTGGEDKLGDVLEARRSETAVGPQLAEGTSATTIENDTPTSADNDAEGAGTDTNETGLDAGDGSAVVGDADDSAPLELEDAQPGDGVVDDTAADTSDVAGDAATGEAEAGEVIDGETVDNDIVPGEGEEIVPGDETGTGDELTGDDLTTGDPVEGAETTDETLPTETTDDAAAQSEDAATDLEEPEVPGDVVDPVVDEAAGTEDTVDGTDAEAAATGDVVDPVEGEAAADATDTTSVELEEAADAIDAAELTPEEGAAAVDIDGDGTDDLDEIEEEEEDKSKPSTESFGEPVMIDSMKECTEHAAIRAAAMTVVLEVCSGLDLLSEKGNVALTTGVNADFDLTSDMFLPNAAETLLRQYQVWVQAAIRDGEPNVRALLGLLNI